MSEYRQSQVQFIDAERSPGIYDKLDRIVPWVKASDDAYLAALLEGFGSSEVLEEWIGCADSELALQNMRILVEDDRICGGFIGFAGRQLRRRRERDLIDLVRKTGSSHYARLRDRLKDLMPLFGPVDGHDFYVSKLGVIDERKGSGIEQPLVEECLDYADRAGYDRVRIDVDESDGRSVDLLETNGFERFDRGCADRAGVVYLNLVWDA